MRVLRLQAKDPVTIFNGQGGEFAGEIVAPDNNLLRIVLGNFRESNLESPLEIELGQGISHGERMDYTIRKAVELGVKSIVPLLTEHCDIHLDAHRTTSRVEHWQKIAINACERCGRNIVPNIATPMSVQRWVEERNFTCGRVLIRVPGKASQEKNRRRVCLA